MGEWVKFGIITLVGLAAGFMATLYFLPDPGPPPAREEFVLSRRELSSILPNQPLPEGRREIIETKPGHAAGHVISSQPRILAPGAYSLTMELDVQEPRDSPKPSCIMDLLAGEHLIGNTPVQTYEGKVELRFRSPAPDGSTAFIMRLFCDGRESVRVFQVKFVRNPDAPPSVIYQR